ncbi:aminofutalosine synthase MqnE [Desulfovibrio litoralis]|uniref:Aminodeoxyfutalosine synthase n=1 Tax=Desulfovibrio litoralis DSM 11393 TaxID=1121455 RepID=A0A1M7TD66_9BACT|nr:aminofutalosine synthase MqnE [Desulfovibrio litoralis]SHN68680.1 aminodeoxyfutalosine synthase [Desulfovibrio litoralis DSM 11393]
MLWSKQYAEFGLSDIYEKVQNGERLSYEDGMRLFECKNPLAVGALAFSMRLRLHGKNTYFVRNRHINYSNICLINCLFCAFRRKENEEGAFTQTHETILEKVCADDGIPFAEVHVVGGCHPTLRLSWFEELFKKILIARPKAVIKAFTAMEIAYFAKQEKCSVLEVLERLKLSGLSMLTGGGAEIFEPVLRKYLCPNKISADEYLSIHGTAHSLGLKSNCSMLFGHIENFAQRVDHLCRLREQQDKSGGFVCFIPLPYLPQNNELSGEYQEKLAKIFDNAQFKNNSDVHMGLERLRTIAIARLMLDNIPHIKAYWVMLGVKTAQAALAFGADDLDGTIVEEHIGHMAGANSSQALTRTELEQMIKDSGLTPVSRDPLFRKTAQ